MGLGLLKGVQHATLESPRRRREEKGYAKDAMKNNKASLRTKVRRDEGLGTPLLAGPMTFHDQFGIFPSFLTGTLVLSLVDFNRLRV
jgi:hypothetical protein